MQPKTAGAVEYTDWISAEGQDPPNERHGYNMKTIGWWGYNPGALRNMEYTFIAIIPWPGVIAPGMVLSMGQIELFDIKKCVHTNDSCWNEL